MFAGFNLLTEKDFKSSYDEGLQMYNSMKKSVASNIEKYVGLNGKIDGNKLQDDWFPTINADVFISHSHLDEELAIGFSGWIYKNFGLNSFIDSCVWGYSDKLLKIIDDKYCFNSDSETYNYDLRNRTTSNVHMMLSSALYKMIDKSECIIFLNTPNSVLNKSVNSTENIIKDEILTESPWIYAEIMATNLIRKKNLSEYRKQGIFKRFEKFANESIDFDMVYILDMSLLTDINDSHLNEWEKYKSMNGNRLDYLYKIIRPNIVNESAEFYKEFIKYGSMNS